MNTFITLVIVIALYAHVGGMMANVGAIKYVEKLEAEGQVCEKIRQQNGPPHARKTYWICDGVEIKWWHGHFWEWWDK